MKQKLLSYRFHKNMEELYLIMILQHNSIMEWLSSVFLHQLKKLKRNLNRCKVNRNTIKSQSLFLNLSTNLQRLKKKNRLIMKRSLNHTNSLILVQNSIQRLKKRNQLILLTNSLNLTLQLNTNHFLTKNLIYGSTKLKMVLTMKKGNSYEE